MACAVVALLAVFAPPAGAITIQFDFSTDSSGFFGVGNPGGLSAGQAARDALLAAGSYYESLLGDSLAAITPGGPNSWEARYYHPATGILTSASNLSIPADTLRVFVGARELGGSTLAQAGPGGFSASGTSSWLNLVATRGEGDTQSPGAVDFGPWGGSLAVDVTTNWYYDLYSLPTTGKTDFYTVILHELGHILGVGTADSWREDVQNHYHTGPYAVAAYGGLVPLDPYDAHWKEGTASTVYPSGPSQETIYDPTITSATRKIPTALDVAVLRDIGWEVTPQQRVLSWDGTIGAWGTKHWTQYYQFFTPIGGESMRVGGGRVVVDANQTGSKAAASLAITGLGSTVEVYPGWTLGVTGAVDVGAGGLLRVDGTLTAASVAIAGANAGAGLPAASIEGTGTIVAPRVVISGVLRPGGSSGAALMAVAPGGAQPDEPAETTTFSSLPPIVLGASGDDSFGGATVPEPPTFIPLLVLAATALLVGQRARRGRGVITTGR